MSTEVFTVTVDGVVRGYLAYQNCADVWFDRTAQTPDLAYKAIGARCECEGYPKKEAALTLGDDDTFMLRWCEACSAVVTPPFDGYAYHDYECGYSYDKQPCSCS